MVFFQLRDVLGIKDRLKGTASWAYDNLGLADRTAIEFFNGGHTINGRGTFDFLHKHLDWPKPD